MVNSSLVWWTSSWSNTENCIYGVKITINKAPVFWYFVSHPYFLIKYYRINFRSPLFFFPRPILLSPSLEVATIMDLWRGCQYVIILMYAAVNNIFWYVLLRFMCQCTLHVSYNLIFFHSTLFLRSVYIVLIDLFIYFKFPTAY